MGIGPTDQALIEMVHEQVVRPNKSTLIEDFHAFLHGQPEMQPFLGDAASSKRLKKAHAKYLENFGQDFDSADYFKYRLFIGETHLQIGLPLHIYLAAFRKLQSLLLIGLWRSSIKNADLLAECTDVVGKFVHLDMSLAIDAYNSSQLETLSQSIDDLESEKQRLNIELMFDSLTGAYSRDYALDYLRIRLAGLVRKNDRTFAVALIDLDHFKNVNDTYGHQVGDTILRDAACLIQKDIRAHDVLGRYGGEEFLLLLLARDEPKALEIAERIRTCVASYEFVADGLEVTVTVSIGISMARPEDTSAELIRRSDEALYLSKTSGRNRVRVL